MRTEICLGKGLASLTQQITSVYDKIQWNAIQGWGQLTTFLQAIPLSSTGFLAFSFLILYTSFNNSYKLL